MLPNPPSLQLCSPTPPIPVHTRPNYRERIEEEDRVRRREAAARLRALQEQKRNLQRGIILAALAEDAEQALTAREWELLLETEALRRAGGGAGTFVRASC